MNDNQTKKKNLPLRYAILGIIGGLIGAFISIKFGYASNPDTIYLTAPISGAVGGFIGGLILKKKKDRKSLR